MLRFFTAGESHGKGIFAYLEGIPANFEIDFDFVNRELSRRQKGYGRGGRMKIEKDRVEFLSGVRLGKTLGSPILMAIWNKDYKNWEEIMKPDPGDLPEDKKVTRPRPGHADLSGVLKYGFDDVRNVLERSSARETAGRVAAGALCKDILRRLGITIGSYVISIGSVEVPKKVLESLSYLERFENAENSEVRIPIDDLNLEKRFKEEIDKAKENGESLGGVFEVFAIGVPVGLGSHTQWDKRLDGKIAQSIMSIQAIKGVEVGIGFESAKTIGSKVHDEIFYSEEKGFYRKTNRAGGIEGGMTNGEPIVIRAAMKPIPTLYNPLKSVDIKTKEPFEASIERSDVCAVPAAAVVGESMLAITLLSALLETFPADNFEKLKKWFEFYLNDE
ncbi:chorismate synthase [Desulfurobacterium thermolithotrophum DSM 11699]|uniref:Chorismate synthase n=1 Tax=Desulfurobacterium thermolithotrophum (strain DSM 11699 / BSA) TaxID=868864 RepID=F0S166_DESTD|nr:chorismate synthase [Desulfurobacterium thermolithotrophum]ADY73944.1 chorismate synthase [Desulfurobacterium thermolithotrophum DSM 11699]